MVTTAKEILEKVEPHDQPILDLLMVDRNQMTTIQLANHFKRSRSDMRLSIQRLLAGNHIYQTNEYGRWAATNYDFSVEIIAKRPDEAASKIEALESELSNLKSDLLKISKRIVVPALTLAAHDYPMSASPRMALSDWDKFINGVKQ